MSTLINFLGGFCPLLMPIFIGGKCPGGGGEAYVLQSSFPADPMKVGPTVFFFCHILAEQRKTNISAKIS